MDQPTDSFPNPLHIQSGETTLWTRANTDEATPGVVHPLHWDFFRVTERALRASAFDRGAYTRKEIDPPARPGDRWVGAFFGRVALNIDALRAVYDRVPGTSADEFEHSMLGSLRPNAISLPSRRRYPLIWARQLLWRGRIAAAVRRNHAILDIWWRRAVSGDSSGDVAAARSRWLEAQRRLEDSTRPHSSVSLWATEAYAALARICSQVSRSELLPRLTGGYGDTEDDRISSALWEVARGQQPLDELVAAHGYNGYFAGNLAARVWREDPGMLEPILASMASMSAEESPEASGRAKAADRRDAETCLLQAVPRHQRGRVRRTLAAAHRYTALRQLGKLTFWRAVDVGRAASRTIGQDLARRGQLGEPEDIFFLLQDEFIPEARSDLRQRVAHRKAQRASYEKLEIPLTWVGNPRPVATASAPTEGDPESLDGMGVSPGRVEGRARVLLDPLRDDPPQPGEILVCRSTDPSWIGLFHLASALVIDVGGPMSHGAIVARELGVPCVINTRVGTRRIATGDLLRVDGTAGSVERLRGAPSRAVPS